MNEQNQIIEQSNEITVTDILSTMFCKKILMLIITVVITASVTLGIVFGHNNGKEVYTTQFNFSADNLESDAEYIDGSKFDYRDIISLKNLTKVKESKEAFNKIDPEKILAEGDISIEHFVEYEEVKNQNANEAPKIKDSYYTIQIKKNAIGSADTAREFVKALIGSAIEEDISKVESIDYTSNLISYDSLNRYDFQLEYLQNQYDLIMEGYDTLIENYGNVMANGNNLVYHREKIKAYFKEYTLGNLKSELDQYGYVKDNSSARIYYNTINYNVDEYKVNKLKLDQLIAQRDEVLSKYASMSGSVENTGLDKIYNQIAEMSTSLEDIKQSIKVNLRRLTKTYERSELEAQFAEALSLIGLTDATSIYADSARGNEAEFEEHLSEFRTKLAEFTEEYKTISTNVMTNYSTVYYKDASIVVKSGGLGFLKAFLIALAAGFIVACIVNLIVGKDRLTYEYRLKRAVERRKQYGLLTGEIKAE